MDSLQDVFGKPAKDSVKVIRFQVVDENQLGSIKGKIETESTVEKGNIIVTAIPLSSKTVRPYQRILPKPGTFEFNDLPEDKYLLSAFIDADSNGVYSYGKPFPFRPSERFVEYPDTLKVRARWPLEGVTIRF